MKNCHVVCDYCGKDAALVAGDVIYPSNPQAHHRMFWFCKPCDAWTATHENSPTHKPIGRMANAQLREARKRALMAFNPLWLAGHGMFLQANLLVSKSYCVGVAYKWLADRMGITTKTCHIGSMNEQQCEQAKRICQSLGNELLVRFQNELSSKSRIQD